MYAPTIQPDQMMMMAGNPAMNYGQKQNASENEIKASQYIKNTPKLNVFRQEDCIQFFCNFRSISYQSQEVGHLQVKRFQPCFVSTLFYWLPKIMCCKYKCPRFIENEHFSQTEPQVVISGFNCGYLTQAGSVIGTYNLDKQGCLPELICGKQSTVIITKSGTNEVFTLKVEDNCLKNLAECCFPCCVNQKKIEISKGGDSTYIRSFMSGLGKCFCCNNHFYDQMDTNFSQNVDNADKLLIYGAFIFLQENTNKFLGFCACSTKDVVFFPFGSCVTCL